MKNVHFSMWVRSEAPKCQVGKIFCSGGTSGAWLSAAIAHVTCEACLRKHALGLKRDKIKRLLKLIGQFENEVLKRDLVATRAASTLEIWAEDDARLALAREELKELEGTKKEFVLNELA